MIERQIVISSRLKGIMITALALSGAATYTESVEAGVDGCGAKSDPIHTVQGNSAASPLVGTEVTIEAIVTGDFQDGAFGVHGDMDGFFVQEEDAQTDVDPTTSEGIFVFDGESPGFNVQPGDQVRITGVVNEEDSRTRLISLSSIEVCADSQPLPTVTPLALPFASLEALESLEGMSVSLDPVLISQHFNFDRYGEITLVPELLFQPTAVFDPGTASQSDLEALNLRSIITLDDGRSLENPDPSLHPNGAEFTLDNTFRTGDRLSGVTGVMDFLRDAYRIQPTAAASHTRLNLRTEQPDPVGGTLKVVAYNVLNYFNGDGMGGGFPAPRGAYTAEDFERQRAKIISALVAIDGDIVGLMELENDGYGEFSAIQDLVDGLNEATAPGKYAFINPGDGALGPDTIVNGMLYQPAKVTPLGSPAILQSSVDPEFLDGWNRRALAQTFEEIATGEVLTVIANHLKSKGSACDAVGDPDTGDGSGRCNLTRARAAGALVDWLAGDPTASGDEDFLVIGDLNSYAMEDPIDVFIDSGYTDLLVLPDGQFEYSFLFNSQYGYLDYAISSPTLTPQVNCATVWHINADEPDLLDYTTRFREPAQDAIYAPDPYRSSDHDPVIVGLNLKDGLSYRSGFENDCPGQ